MTTYQELCDHHSAEMAWRRDVLPGLVLRLKAAGATAEAHYAGDVWEVVIHDQMGRIIGSGSDWQYAAAVADAWRDAARKEG